MLERIDKALTVMGIEKRFVVEQLDLAIGSENLSARRRQAVRALRCTLAKMLLGDDWRGMAVSLAESALLQRFCRIDELDVVTVPAKSALQRYENIIAPQELKELNKMLIRHVADEAGAQKIELDRFFIDSTRAVRRVLKLNSAIHFCFVSRRKD